MSLNDLTVPAIVIFICTLISGNVGSFSSIRPEWHAQNIYHRCVMPSVTAVCFPAEIIGLVLGLATFYIISDVLSFSRVIGIVSGCIVALPTTFLVARNRGARIYSENVRHAGF